MALGPGAFHGNQRGRLQPFPCGVRDEVEDRVVGSDFRPLILTKLKVQTTAAANKSHTNSSMYHTSSLIIPFLRLPTPFLQPLRVNASAVEAMSEVSKNGFRGTER
jgi:hypothetical protein